MAVSLGADADTLGAIVGSIAEAIWGIPLAMSQVIEHQYLPDDERAELMSIIDQEKDDIRSLMAERAKARENWWSILLLPMMDSILIVLLIFIQAKSEKKQRKRLTIKNNVVFLHRPFSPRELKSSVPG